MHTLLFLEELQHCVDVRQFDMHDEVLNTSRALKWGEIPLEFFLTVRFWVGISA